MTVFFGCIALLVIGYFTYGAFVEKVFGIEPGRPTPCCQLADGVDYVEMPTWRVFFIQLLDIAGLGPVFGPILAVLYGPVALVWIVLGSIFAGAVHDYFSGMLSVRDRGASIPEVVGNYLGMTARQVMRLFSVILLLLVGVVFITGPAKLLANISGMDVQLWVGIIFAYYFLATILPIDKIIGQLYPIFGALLLFMSVGVMGGLFYHGYTILPNLDVLTNVHPEKLPIWPLIFVTLSCGAISGFHSTQSPLMARCISNERHGRLVFYGAMIVEGIIALIWATAGMSFYADAPALQAVIKTGTPSLVVKEVCTTLLGPVGGALAILGVVVLPVTSGDTAFRSTRLIIAETLGMEQKAVAKRLLIALPLFAIAFVLTQVNFDIIWRYFGWANQMLSMLMLWAAACYLAQQKKNHWVCSIPATFMTAVDFAFILQAKIGFNLPADLSNILGVGGALAVLGLFLVYANRRRCCPAPAA